MPEQVMPIQLPIAQVPAGIPFPDGELRLIFLPFPLAEWLTERLKTETTTIKTGLTIAKSADIMKLHDRNGERDVRD